MIYDKYRRFLYAITQTRLHKIRIANCALADNCQQCLAKTRPVLRLVQSGEQVHGEERVPE